MCPTGRPIWDAQRIVNRNFFQLTSTLTWGSDNSKYFINNLRDVDHLQGYMWRKKTFVSPSLQPGADMGEVCCVLLALSGCISTPETGYQVDEEPDKSVGSDVADRSDTEEEEPGVDEVSGVVGCVLDGPLDGGPNISAQSNRNGLSSFASMASKDNRRKRCDGASE